MTDTDREIAAEELVELGFDQLANVAGGLKPMWMDEEGD